jgi:hypothetical protein
VKSSLVHFSASFSTLANIVPASHLGRDTLAHPSLIMRGGCSNAGYATDFVDAQLTTLYNIACDRIKCYTDKGIDRSEQSGYDFALREYHYKKSTAPSLQVVFEFNVPRIEFICDHYAILHLTIESAVSSEATPFSFGDGPVTVSIGIPLKIDVSSDLFIYKLTLNPNGMPVNNRGYHDTHPLPRRGHI